MNGLEVIDYVIIVFCLVGWGILEYAISKRKREWGENP